MLELLAQEKDLLNKLVKTQAKIADTKDKLAKEKDDLDAIDSLAALTLIEASNHNAEKPNHNAEKPNLLPMIISEAANVKLEDLHAEHVALMEVNDLLTAEEAINDQDISQLEEEIELEEGNIKSEGTYLFDLLQSKLTLLKTRRYDLKTKREQFIRDVEAVHNKILRWN